MCDRQMRAVSQVCSIVRILIGVCCSKEGVSMCLSGFEIESVGLEADWTVKSPDDKGKHGRMPNLAMTTSGHM